MPEQHCQEGGWALLKKILKTLEKNAEMCYN
jgi:hypothetical protein